MELLVSVASAEDARAAVLGGAQIIDAKDPATGSLGAVALTTLEQIRAVVPRERLMTAAVGEVFDPGALEQRAYEFVARGATLVKVGVTSIRDVVHLEELVAAGVRGCGRVPGAGLVVVWYADVGSSPVPRMALIDLAVRAGARGVLVDTVDKRGPGLLSCWSADELEAWVAHAHEVDVFASVAGRLDADGLVRVRDSGADVAGVRGAACEGGRTGVVSAARVRDLLARLGDTSAPPIVPMTTVSV